MLFRSGEVEIEYPESFGEKWGWLHGYYQRDVVGDGAHPVPLLHVEGRGHWLGMLLYASGHDHGGGDFVVVDGASEQPGWIHGINGEDYFNFAWFQTGNHFPYAASLGSLQGRYRLHLENPYPFWRSLQVFWGTFPGEQPRSLALWYQDQPGGQPIETPSESWDLFGPLPIRSEK